MNLDDIILIGKALIVLFLAYNFVRIAIDLWKLAEK